MRKIVSLFAIVGCVAFAGCTRSQAESCRKFTACSEALSPGSKVAMDLSYGKDGPCWKTSDSTAACTAACDNGLAGLKANPGFATTDACK